MNDFVHLHLHTEYSLLDGASRIKDIPEAIEQLGQKAVAITDHGNMYGVVAFYKACKARGIKPIIGCEVYMAAANRQEKKKNPYGDNYHLILLVKNETGYKNLISMVSKSYTEGFYIKPRIDMELLREHHEGLICLSGCLGGLLPQLLLRGEQEKAEKTALAFRTLFGEDYYLELQDHGLNEQKQVNHALFDLGNKLGIELVCTNDAHYLRKQDAENQAVLMCIQTNEVITNGRPIGFETDEFYIKSADEMEVIFKAYPRALENTVKIADKCNFDFEFGKLHLPAYYIENGLTAKEYLRKIVERGFLSKIMKEEIHFTDEHPVEVYRERLDYELSIIDKMGYNDYFLIVWDFVNYAKQHGVTVGPGRGSGAGSLVAYMAGITEVDSIAFDLLFERFLNPERISMPDFDIDFCYRNRDKVIEYVREKYGKDNVSQITTFGTMAARAVVRDVGRALGMSYATVDQVAKAIPRELNITLETALEKNKDLKELAAQDPQIDRLLSISRALEGMPRHASTHAAGVVITEQPTRNYVPVSVNEDMPLTQFDMDTVADLGLLKFDFLGLRYLTIIDDCAAFVQQSDPSFSVHTIPFNDEETHAMIAAGKTDGVFQLESAGMRQMLTQMKPTSLDDIMASIALYRPGPMKSIPRYIHNKHHPETASEKRSAVSDILEKTYGCIVYQEQVMQIFRSVAGYSYGQADLIRKAMSKKKADVLEKERTAFIEGALATGNTKEEAQALFDEMADFAKYAFNKSHAAAYSFISYRTAYLKCHYPAEYMCALLTSVTGYTDKINEYIAVCKNACIEVLPPDINESRDTFVPVEGKIRFSLGSIKNLGEKFVQLIITERNQNGPYRSFENFANRLSGQELNKKQMQTLISSGAFDTLGANRKQLFAVYETFLDSLNEKRRRNLAGQIDLFSDPNEPEADTLSLPIIDDFTLQEKLLLERESCGLSLSGSMLDAYTAHINALKPTAILDVIRYDEEHPEGYPFKDRQTVTIACIVTNKTAKDTKNGERMLFITAEDTASSIEMLIFPKLTAQYEPYLTKDACLAITGSISLKEGEKPKLLVSRVVPLMENKDFKGKAEDMMPQSPSNQTSTEGKKMYLRLPDTESSAFHRIISLVEIFPGDCEVILYNQSTGKYSKAQNCRIALNQTVLALIRQICGEENVVLQ
ncbi:MAG: DNA polymerase III subunit alpha [Clostridiales bacterium]|nr:DNA polymerase III subunit alpha [Clostridiales bacterium]